MFLLLLTSCRLFSDYVFDDELDTAAQAGLESFGGTISIFGSDLPLEGVAVCLFSEPTDPCVTTDEAGRFTMPRPNDGPIIVSMEHPLYQPSLYFLEMGPDTPDLQYQMLGLALRDLVVGSLEPEPDLDLGLLVLSGAGLEGATGLLIPGDGEGPIYPDALGNPEGNTSVVANLALWYSVPDGAYEMGLTLSLIHISEPTRRS